MFLLSDPLCMMRTTFRAPIGVRFFSRTHRPSHMDLSHDHPAPATSPPALLGLGPPRAGGMRCRVLSLCSPRAPNRGSYILGDGSRRNVSAGFINRPRGLVNKHPCTNSHLDSRADVQRPSADSDVRPAPQSARRRPAQPPCPPADVQHGQAMRPPHAHQPLGCVPNQGPNRRLRPTARAGAEIGPQPLAVPLRRRCFIRNIERR